jgi:hypothetical protein
MISPKLIFQCSSASLFVATVLAAPVWAPQTLGYSDDEVLGAHDDAKPAPTVRVEPVRTQPVLRSADASPSAAKVDNRSIEERNQAARQVIGELENTLEFRDSPDHHEAIRLRQQLEEHRYEATRQPTNCSHYRNILNLNFDDE